MIGELRSQEQTQNQGATVLPAIEIRIENLHKSFGTHRVLKMSLNPFQFGAFRGGAVQRRFS